MRGRSIGDCAQVLIYGDCAVNVHPSSNELAQIAVTSADTAAAFGVEPRVALLSYSTFGSGSGPEVDRVSTSSHEALRPDACDISFPGVPGWGTPPRALSGMG